MKYVFLENTTESNKNNGGYTHYYSYYITNNNKFTLDDFSQMHPKQEINYKLDHYKLDSSQYIVSAFSKSHCPKKSEPLLNNVFNYILDKGLDSRAFLKLTIDNNDNVIEVE